MFLKSFRLLVSSTFANFKAGAVPLLLLYITAVAGQIAKINLLG